MEPHTRSPTNLHHRFLLLLQRSIILLRHKHILLHLFSDSPKTLDSLLAGPVTLVSNQDTEFIFTPADIAGSASKIQKIVASIINGDLQLFVACCLDQRFYECPPPSTAITNTPAVSANTPSKP